MKLRKILIILLFTLIFATYLTVIAYNSEKFMDAWVLEGIFCITLAFLIITILVSYLLFPYKTGVIFFLSIYSFFIVTIPVLKYPNETNIVGCWDSLAHYSFSNWILSHGRIPQNVDLIYSVQYGFHPGNGILPSTLTLVTVFRLGFSMNVILIINYLVYILLLYSLTVSKQFISSKRMPLTVYMLISTIFSLLFLWHYYVGMTISYVFIGIILYYILRWTLFKENMTLNSYILFTIVFLGLLLTHLSSTTLIILFLIVFSLFFNLVCFLYNEMKYELNLKNINLLLLSVVMIYILYQFFADYLFTHSLIRSAVKIIQGLYIREFYLVSSKAELYGLSFSEILRLGISAWIKYLIIVFVAMSLVVYIFIKHLIGRIKIERKNFFPRDFVISFMIIISGLLWLVGYIATGELMQGGRVIPILQFITIYSIFLFVKTKNIDDGSKKIKDRIKIFVLFFFLLLNIISNYGLQPISPIIRVENYNMRAGITIGPVSDYVLFAIVFTNAHISAGVTFAGLEPYITFGYMDLLWNVSSKKLFIRDLSLSNDSLIALGDILKYTENAIIPMTPFDNVIPGKLGYRKFYEVPTMYLVINCDLIYTNRYYILFFR